MSDIEYKLKRKTDKELTNMLESDDYTKEHKRFVIKILKERGVSTDNCETEEINSKLVACEDCGKKMSKEAAACPKCGKPNKKVAVKKRDQTQKVGCLLIVIGGIAAFLIAPLFGGIAVVVGFVIILLSFVLK